MNGLIALDVGGTSIKVGMITPSGCLLTPALRTTLLLQKKIKKHF